MSSQNAEGFVRGTLRVCFGVFLGLWMWIASAAAIALLGAGGILTALSGATEEYWPGEGSSSTESMPHEIVPAEPPDSTGGR